VITFRKQGLREDSLPGPKARWMVLRAIDPNKGAMAMTRLTMRQIKEISRQKWLLGRTHREVAASIGRSPGVVASALARATAVGVTWTDADAMSEDALEERLYDQGQSVQIA